MRLSSRSLLSPVQKLLAEAEESLGTRIELVEDSRLPVAGTTAVIPGRPNYGVIRYSPKYGHCYVVANQCCRILRYVRAPPEYRLVPIERRGAYPLVYSEVEQHALRSELGGLPNGARQRLARLFVDGLITQVTSVPADCRIDGWLYAAIPVLRHEERLALGSMLELYSESSRPRIKSSTPPAIYRASNAMNGAFARNAAGLFPDLQEHALRYEEEFGELVDVLSAHLNGEDGGHVSDVRTADAWAKELGLSELYEWKREDEVGRQSRKA